MHGPNNGIKISLHLDERLPSGVEGFTHSPHLLISTCIDVVIESAAVYPDLTSSPMVVPYDSGSISIKLETQ